MPNFELFEDEHDAVVTLIRHTLNETRYPFSDENQALLRALYWLDPASVSRPLAQGLAEAPGAQRQ
jgi:hypothetical protein